ncbi:hypothetical protein NPIL_107591 [Nephila pilipes]|uniref:Uncharacterized protein n=1 Tax=Nephila pilipes TaxID=299642 RepID=A0A8X6TUS8_NEPPI|nr:hypothetical protein NPIL_107591 [Nephila pilipes]
MRDHCIIYPRKVISLRRRKDRLIFPLGDNLPLQLFIQNETIEKLDTNCHRLKFGIWSHRYKYGTHSHRLKFGTYSHRETDRACMGDPRLSHKKNHCCRGDDHVNNPQELVAVHHSLVSACSIALARRFEQPY